MPQLIIMEDKNARLLKMIMQLYWRHIKRYVARVVHGIALINARYYAVLRLVKAEP